MLLKKAVELNPTNERAVGNLGTNYFLRGEFINALRWQKKAAGLNPKNAIPFQIIGWTYRLLGDIDQATAWLEKSLELGAHWDTYELLGYCYVLKGNNPKALSLIPKVLELGPDDSRTLETAALIAHFAGDTQSAKKYFQLSIDKNVSYKTDPNTVSPISIGQILLDEGNKIDSEVYFAHAMEINLHEIERGSQDDGPLFNIAGIYAIRGNTSQAAFWLKKAVEKQWVDYTMVTHGPWFKSIRNDHEILEITNGVRSRMDAILRQEETH